ncbi:HutD/Ves family protein [Achromobacter marplatensis]|uniref:HutD/Ves family protein n=1 Tax=Achromobacter marplatensis TaxID=470868 RepID=UPI0039F70051
MAPSPDPVRIAQAEWQELPPEPWKNGAGVTRTLAVDTQPVPRWRVSIADIERDGPYSRLPGQDRVSVVLSGEGVTLQGEGKKILLLPGVPTAFAGDVAFQSRLLGGPVRVLNLFVLRGAAQGAVSCSGWGRAASPVLAVGSLALGAGPVQAFGFAVEADGEPWRGGKPDAVRLDLRVVAAPPAA